MWEQHNTLKYAATFAFAIFAYELWHSWGAIFLVQFLSSSSWRQKDGSDNWQGGTLHPPIIADYSNEGQNLRNGNAAAMTNSPCPFWAGKNPKHNPPFLGLLRRWTWRPPLTSSSSRYGFKVEGGVGWGYIRSVKRYCIEYGKEQRVENSP